MTIKPANGATGHILRVGFSEWVFRVYDNEHNFIDYDLHHSDLCVTIADEDAFFYKKNGVDCLDHSPKTLGLE